MFKHFILIELIIQSELEELQVYQP